MDRITKHTVMDSVVVKFKELIWGVFTAIGSVLMPVRDILILLAMSFVFNIFTGIITDIHVNKARFSIKKAFNAITQLTFYATCVVFVDHGSKLIDEHQMGVTAVKWITIIVVYFYLTNIFKNAKQVYPNSQAINFIYEILSTEFFARLKNMIGIKKNQEEES